jgi:hypothetical protein
MVLPLEALTTHHFEEEGGYQRSVAEIVSLRGMEGRG